MSVVVTLTLGEKAMPISFVALGIVGKKWEPTFLGENSEKYFGNFEKNTPGKSGSLKSDHFFPTV